MLVRHEKENDDRLGGHDLDLCVFQIDYAGLIPYFWYKVANVSMTLYVWHSFQYHALRSPTPCRSACLAISSMPCILARLPVIQCHVFWHAFRCRDSPSFCSVMSWLPPGQRTPDKRNLWNRYKVRNKHQRSWKRDL
nr:hypothetical protein [Tanacetum cinerariifolium]